MVFPQALNFSLSLSLSPSLSEDNSYSQLLKITVGQWKVERMEEIEPCIPPGFRFHPTEEELVGYYLARKVACQKIDMEVIQEVDLYRIEPWDLQADRCKYTGHELQSEWYFFSYKDRKYPTGTRTNRATAAGFWKATGRDKPVISHTRVIGMRKTLVFYKGRAPNGRKTDWIMHEYRLQSLELIGPPQEEGWVVCRAFQKPSPAQRPCYNTYYHSPYSSSTNPEEQYGLEALSNFSRPPDSFLRYHSGGADISEGASHGVEIAESKRDLISHVPAGLPKLGSPSLSTSLSAKDSNAAVASDGQTIDWKVLEYNLLSSDQLDESASSQVPFAGTNNEADAQSQVDQFFAFCGSSYC